jgi:magnesium chelatase family protein
VDFRVERALSRAQLGVEASLVRVQLSSGLPAPVVRESRERVRAAVLSSGYTFPIGCLTVNLAPVELSKQGGRDDLPIALAVLRAPRRGARCDGRWAEGRWRYCASETM